MELNVPVFKTSDPVVVIAGGVGPMAGVEFHRDLLVMNSQATRDCDHWDTLHVAFPSMIPDRTHFLRTGNGENPGHVIARLIQPYLQLLRESRREYAVMVPCATFHAPVILDAFKAALGDAIKGRFVSMVDPAVTRAIQYGPRVGFMSTSGSRIGRVWDSGIEQAGGISCVLDRERQEELHEAIYQPGYGLKAVTPPSEAAVARLQDCIDNLCDQGANSIILGCTELPLAETRLRTHGAALIDPGKEIARALQSQMPHKEYLLAT